MTSAAELLQATPEEAVRRIVIDLLDGAQKTLPRLDDPKDTEALHDFRVGVRRLRSALKSWRRPLGKAVKPKYRKRLRALQNETGGGRDAEVALAWLDDQAGGLRPVHRLGFDWLVERLEERRRDAMAHVRSAIRTRFDKIDRALRPELETMTMTVRIGKEPVRPRFASALAKAARAQVDEIARRLTKIRSSDEEESLHEVRLCGKRIRYLLEPVKGAFPEVANTLKTCKRLQELLGNLNDGFVLRAELRTALEDAAVERARLLHDLSRLPLDDRVEREMRRTERPGLLEVTRRNEDRIRTLFRRIERDWINSAAAPLVDAIETLGRRLDGAPTADVEIERKYLLTRVPDLGGLDVTMHEIEQGYLPGEKLRERVRCIRTLEGADRFVRTLKAGRGVSRIEVEEECDATTFAGLWLLTEGSRVLKRRYAVREGDRVWEIDVFTDRELVLAEIELEDPDETVTFPDWLAPCVAREVTEEKGFTNLELAS